MKSYSEFIVESHEALNKISSAYERKYPGMKLNLSHSPITNNVRVDLIRVPKEKRGLGIGTRAITGVKNYAKRHNLPVTLSQEPEKGKKGKLQKFYKRLEFKKNQDPAISDTHVYHP
jgi:hypothetical protein